MKESLGKTLFGMSMLLLAAVLSTAVMGGFRLEFVPPPPVNPLDVSLKAEAMGVTVLSTEEMREVVNSGSHLIFDARLQFEYDEGHIPGAFSVSVQNFEDSFPTVLPLLTPDTLVAVYCSGPFCDDALNLIERMREAGFMGAELYLDGMEGWSE